MKPKESDQLRLDRHQGLSARKAVADFEEFVYSAQATQPKVSNQLRLDLHQGLRARSLVAHFDEFIYSALVMQPNPKVKAAGILLKCKKLLRVTKPWGFI